MECVPIKMDESGSIRVSGTRVTLDAIIGSYQAGNTAECIASSYPVVPLADVHQVIAYYLRHKVDVDQYLDKRRLEGEKLRRLIEAEFPSDDIRERILARRRKQ